MCTPDEAVIRAGRWDEVKRIRFLLALSCLCGTLLVTGGGTSGTVRGPAIHVRAGTSTNWAGYAAAGAPGSYTHVSATWTQPSVHCGSQGTYSAYWVGLDGDTTNTVEQLGTEADCSNGKAVFYSWYEMYPRAGHYATVAVVPGHTYHASVAYQGSGSFLLTLQDTSTRSAPFTTLQKLNGAKLASAEAIVEAPYSGGVLPLSNFGSTTFSGVTADGTTMHSPPADGITMVNSTGGIKAKPSGLQGGSFSVTWVSS
jgi:hypothetical protein